MNKLSAQHLVAHRGWQLRYPENSRSAILAAIAAGVRYIEVDIQFSRDGVPILCHDVQLQRLTGKSLSIFDLDADQLQQVYCSEPSRLSTQFPVEAFMNTTQLMAIAKANPSCHFYIELKEESIEHFGLDYCLEALDNLLLENCSLISFSLAAIEKAKQQYNFAKAGLVTRDWQGREAAVQKSASDFIFIKQDYLPDEGLLLCSVPVCVYEIADKDLALSLLQRGASQIESFDAAGLLRQA